MFKKLKMRIAALRVEKKKAKTKNKKNLQKANKSFYSKIKTNIKKFFSYINSGLRHIWNRICDINLIGLINTTLLCVIITVFSMLILDITCCNKKQVIVITKNNVTTINTPQNQKEVKKAKDLPSFKPGKNLIASLPLKKDPFTNKFTDSTIDNPNKKCTILKDHIARKNTTIYGDLIIDSYNATNTLKNGDTIKGNLYIQNMRKYILPCNIRIEGNLFLRDVNMLQFCGDFTVTGNIYVSPRSSFGPIPRTARLGGQVIL